MKFLAVAALFVATALAVPTESYSPPPLPNYTAPSSVGSNPFSEGGFPSEGGSGGHHPPLPHYKGGDGGYCPDGFYANPECCALDVLGIADLNCQPPPSVPSDIWDFRSICAKEGAEARCCVLPVAGQAVLCEDPVSP